MGEFDEKSQFKTTRLLDGYNIGDRVLKDNNSFN